MSTIALGVRTASRGFAVGVVGAVFVCALSSSALAQPGDDTTAKAIVDDAVVQYNLGHFLEASALFEKAYHVDPAPILLFNIGQCHRRLGNNDLALFFYRRYLDQAPANAAERPDVIKRVADLERSIREQSDLKNKPPPGVARDAGGTTGNLPALPEPTAAGTNLAPTAAPLNQSPLVQPADDDPSSGRTLRNVAWITGGVAVGSLVVGLVGAFAWSDRAARFNNHVGTTVSDPGSSARNCGADESNYGGAGCAALYSDVSSARTISIVGLAGGVALAAGSLILFLRSMPRESTVSSIGAACAPNLYSPGLICRLSF